MQEIIQELFSDRIEYIKDAGKRFNVVFMNKTVSSYDKNDLIKILYKQINF